MKNEDLKENQIWVLPNKTFEGVKILKIENDKIYFKYFAGKEAFKKIVFSEDVHIGFNGFINWIERGKCILDNTKNLNNVSFKQLNR